ncbi:glycosyltransferase family 2 protein [Bifidobacterium leontopitheci]|uniref:Glycosyl transferase family 2 n=1 Tax=Bifidobacterium leontopitheci TaxID=2650774 RepID=A0A6I1GD74_9BIFI|nr:glycosyltransferase family 2 protein [Bifidobacterium leontopitheci]KAB7789594.1 Glycosyl transferase family 2 [Bifidobacterium leontopitheci]
MDATGEAAGGNAATLVSVIVPMYDVAPFAAECLDSLLAMDVPSGVRCEIIVVDDGSHDATGAIADRYAAADAAIRVFHTANHGLSAARNFGVRQARGEYVTFVDGDDMVTQDYLTALWAGLGKKEATDARHRETDNVDVVHNQTNNMQPAAEVAPIALVVGTFKPFRTGRPPHGPIQSASSTRLHPNQAVAAMLTGYLPISVWAKLAPRQWYLDMPFPDNRVCEDLEIIIPLLRRADSIILLATPIYRYRQRRNSLSHPRQPNRQQAQDFIRAITAMRQACAALGYANNDPRLAYQTVLQYMRLHRLVRRLPGDTRAWDSMVVNEVQQNRDAALRAPGIGRTGRLRIRLFCASRLAYDLLFDVYDIVRRGR